MTYDVQEIFPKTESSQTVFADNRTGETIYGNDSYLETKEPVKKTIAGTFTDYATKGWRSTKESTKNSKSKYVIVLIVLVVIGFLVYKKIK